MFAYRHQSSLFVARMIQVTLLVTVIATFIEQMFHLPLMRLFTLNHCFYTDFYLWQPITSLFFIPDFDFAFSPILNLVFIMMLYWFIAGQVYTTFGRKRFFTLFVGAPIAATLLACVAMCFSDSFYPLTLLYSQLLAFVTVWTMSSPTQRVMVWMLFPISSKWFLLLSLAFTVLNNFVYGSSVAAMAYLGAALFAYLVAVMCWHQHGPFIKLWPLEAFLKRRSQAISRFWNWRVMGPIRRWRQRTTIE